MTTNIKTIYPFIRERVVKILNIAHSTIYQYMKLNKSFLKIQIPPTTKICISYHKLYEKNYIFLYKIFINTY